VFIIGCQSRQPHCTIQSERVMLRRIWLVAVHLILLLLLYRYALPAVLHRLGEPDKQFTLHYQDMLSFHLRGDAALPAGRIMFLGDSLTQGLPVSLVTDLGVNYGIGTDDTEGLLNRIAQYESLPRAKTIVVAIGINDLKHRSVADTLAQYQTVLDKLPAEPDIVCSALLPIDESAREDWMSRSIKLINAFNQQLDSLCTEHGAAYIAAAPSLSDAAGNLLPQLHTGDGLHLNAAGNALWAAYLRDALRATEH